MHPANSHLKVGKLPNVYVTAETKYGNCRIRTTSRLWEEANPEATNPEATSNHNPGMDSSRKHLAKKIREVLNKKGARIPYLKWGEIFFGPISYQKEPEATTQPQPSALALHNEKVAQMAKEAEAMVANEELDEATRLFPGFFGSTPPPSDSDTCGCVPRPITAM